MYSADALSCAAFGDLAVLADPPLESFLHHNFLPYLFELPAQPSPLALPLLGAGIE